MYELSLNSNITPESLTEQGFTSGLLGDSICITAEKILFKGKEFYADFIFNDKLSQIFLYPAFDIRSKVSAFKTFIETNFPDPLAVDIHTERRSGHFTWTYRHFNIRFGVFFDTNSEPVLIINFEECPQQLLA